MKVGIFINTTKSEANTAANEFGRILTDNSIESKVVNLKEDCKENIQSTQKHGAAHVLSFPCSCKRIPEEHASR